MNQEQLDNVIRKQTQEQNCAVEEMTFENEKAQEYKLSDGTFLWIWKASGSGFITDKNIVAHRKIRKQRKGLKFNPLKRF